MHKVGSEATEIASRQSRRSFEIMQILFSTTKRYQDADVFKLMEGVDQRMLVFTN
jgi:hypothetical protein